MAKPKILFVLPWLPYPLTSGGRQAVFNGIKALKDFADIIITFKSTSEIAEEDINQSKRLIGDCDIIPYLIPSNNLSQDIDEMFLIKVLNKYKSVRHSIKLFIKSLCTKKEKQARNTCHRVPSYSECLDVIYPFDEGFAYFICEIIRKKCVNIVQFDMILNANLVYFIPDYVKKVLVHHEIRTAMYEIEMDSMAGWDLAKKAYLDFFRQNEVSILNKFDAIITLSETDRDKLVKYGVTTAIYPSFAVVNTAIVEDPVIDTSNILSFVGGDIHRPNYEGIKWFLDNCWRKLIDIDSSYQLQIIGNSSEQFIYEISSNYPNVCFTGYVENLSSIIQNTIMIVPILTGSGIRMKILEAAAIGCPIVSTSVGAEGLPMQHKVNCLIADTPDSFINAILEYKSLNIRRSVVKEARQMVKNKYTFDKFRDDRLSIYERLQG